MTAPNPGWYPHPDDPHSLRWWDGTAWTDFVAPRIPPAAVAAEPPVAESSAVEAPGAPAEGTEGVPPEAAPAAEPPAAEPAAAPVAAEAPAAPAAEPAAPAAEAPAPDPGRVTPLPVAPPPVQPLEPGPLAPVTPLPVRQDEPEPVGPPPAARRSRRGPVVAGLAVLAAAGVAAALLLSGDSSPKGVAKHGGPPVADRVCLRVWNGTDTADAVNLRRQAGQFNGSYARLVRVAPIPGTLMQPGSCALEAYQPETDTHLIAVAGVKDQLGYLDVTAYPRAASLGWPTSAKQANVRISADGSLRAIVRR
jgi:Protein of unknown function (DUF2510)